jgi:hypothetical protein
MPYHERGGELKHIVSVSLGSSKRNHKVEADILGDHFVIERIGTDGDMRKAEALLREIDGHVDGIGLGGIDIYLHSRKGTFALKDGLKLKNAVKSTPVVDGSGLKNTLERAVVNYLEKDPRFSLREKKVLMVCAMDRFGMAEAFVDAGCVMLFGDLIFALDKDQPISTLDELADYAEKLLPEISKLPIGFIYPIGKKQDNAPEEKYSHYYHDADYIAGDYHFIRKYLPVDLSGKIIVTNTVTQQDVAALEERRARYLVTTTPEFEGRSFGTNVLEAIFMTFMNKPWEEVKGEDYRELIEKLQLKPRVVELNS